MSDDLKTLNEEGMFPQEAPEPSNPFVRFFARISNYLLPTDGGGGN